MVPEVRRAADPSPLPLIAWPDELSLAAMASPVSVTWPPAPLGNKAFTGREWDPETGLYYFRARYLDPKIGRFISEDPLPVEVREVDELNAYAYVSNNPINYTDALGVAKGGKQNIGAEDFTKQSKAADVQKALDQAIKLRQVKRIKALKGLLKVIKRGGAMGLVGGLTLDWTLDDYIKDLEAGRCERTTPVPQPAPPPPPTPGTD